MLVILSISNITVDDLHYGKYTTTYSSTFVSITFGRTVLVEYYGILLMCSAPTFYGTGSLLVILISNIIVNELHIGIFRTSHIFIYICRHYIWKNSITVEYYGVSLVLVLSTVLSKSTGTQYNCF